MGRIIGGMATSHAFAFLEPAKWDEFRARNRQSLLRRTGVEPPPHPRLAVETVAEDERRFARVREAHEALRQAIASHRPDALILIGDDQHENFVSVIPQIAVYVGDTFRLAGHFARGDRRYGSHGALAAAILEQGIRDGFDVTAVRAFEEDALKSHAHVQVLQELAVPQDLPIVLVFVNAVSHPTIEPARCFAFGEAIARAVAARPAGERVMVCASGGLSHFTAGYPWRGSKTPLDYGDISEDFDRRALTLIERGQGAELAALTSEHLHEHGDIELRSWIALLGAMGPTPARFTLYEPFYRAVMGMGVAYWPEAAERADTVASSS
jgi:aromatic ring-opening dioxygenase LigB subunit